MDISVVIPAFNEEGNVKELFTELKGVLDSLKKSYEVLFIDDGSSDGTFAVLKGLAAKEKCLKVVKLRKNFGQTASLAIGFKQAQGEVVVVMDADMQNDPHDIPALVTQLSKGFDVVSGWRKKRKDSFGKKSFSLFANLFRRMITTETIHDSGCSLKVYKKAALRNLRLYGEMHRFIPLLLSWKGFKIGELEVHHRARKSGKTKYGVIRVMKGFLDLLTIKFWVQYSNKPMHLFGGLGIVSFLLGIITGLYLVYGKLVLGLTLSNRPLLLLAILLIVLGVQLFALGLLADILVKMYFERQKDDDSIEKIV